MQKTWIGFALLAATTLTVAPGAAAVTPGKVQIFKDWTVGCDNGLDCQAVALLDEQSADARLSIVLTRESGPGTALTINLSTNALKSGRYSVRVDARTLTRGTTLSPD